MNNSSVPLKDFILILSLIAPLYYVTIFQNVKEQYDGAGGAGINVKTSDLNLFTNRLDPNSGSQAKCINFDENLDELVASSSTIFIAMPAKASGSSMQKFTWKCARFSSDKVDKRIDTTSVKDTLPFLVDNGVSSRPEKLLTFHLYRDEPFEVLLDNIPRDALVVYIYREETDRLLSAIKQVLHVSCERNKHPENIVPLLDGNRCWFNEKDVVENVIRPRIFEIGWGNPEIMTCSFYEAIKRNYPRMVFMNYKQADRLQVAIGKNKCPDADFPVKKNMGDEKDIKMFIELNLSGELISLDDWLEQKRDMLEWTLQLKGKNKCQAKTRTMEDQLFACKDELLEVTRDTSF